MNEKKSIKKASRLQEIKRWHMQLTANSQGQLSSSPTNSITWFSEKKPLDIKFKKEFGNFGKKKFLNKS